MKFSLNSIEYLEQEVTTFTDKQSFIQYVSSITKKWLKPSRLSFKQLKIPFQKNKRNKIILALYTRAGYGSVDHINGLGEAIWDKCAS